MGVTEADQARPLGVPRDGALEADGPQRVGCAFGGADDGGVSRLEIRGTLEEPPLAEKSFPES